MGQRERGRNRERGMWDNKESVTFANYQRRQEKTVDMHSAQLGHSLRIILFSTDFDFCDTPSSNNANNCILPCILPKHEKQILENFSVLKTGTYRDTYRIEQGDEKPLMTQIIHSSLSYIPRYVLHPSLFRHHDNGGCRIIDFNLSPLAILLPGMSILRILRADQHTARACVNGKTLPVIALRDPPS